MALFIATSKERKMDVLGGEASHCLKTKRDTAAWPIEYRREFDSKTVGI